MGLADAFQEVAQARPRRRIDLGMALDRSPFKLPPEMSDP
jgi:hypothetical protein